MCACATHYLMHMENITNNGNAGDECMHSFVYVHTCLCIYCMYVYIYTKNERQARYSSIKTLKCSRAPLHTHYMNSKKFVTCLRVYKKLMTYQLLAESKNLL